MEEPDKRRKHTIRRGGKKQHLRNMAEEVEVKVEEEEDEKKPAKLNEKEVEE